MKIERFLTDTTADRKRVSATVTWEDCDQPPCEIYFETDSRFGESLWCNPDAFLVGCVIPAFALGEARVLVEEAICPELRDGLMTALMWLRRWYYPRDHKLPRIDAKIQASVPRRTMAVRTGLLFSGGIDSLSVLRWNRIHIPREHPASIQDGVLIFGIQNEDAQMRKDIEAQLSFIAEDAAVTLIPTSTNLIKVFNEVVHWEYQWEASALAAVAHTLAGRLSHLTIASTNDIGTMIPLGSHPVLDPYYSSRDLCIRHEGITLSRFAKTKLVAEWDTALQNLRVCNKIPYGQKTHQGTLNCGKCEKCIRTMLGLVALGALDRTRAFPCTEVSADLVRTIPYFSPLIRYRFYLDMVEPLRQKGREDLARAIEDLIRRSRPMEVVDILKGKLVEVDRRYLNGWLGKAKRLALSAVHPATVNAKT
jgi:hypothetical protein